MLTPGNTKLGKVYNWSIPAIATCPGASEVCKLLCYGTKGRYRTGTVQSAHERNYDACKKPGWWREVTSQIRRSKPATVRIHAVGDFFNRRYIRDWIRIIEANPNTKFYAYTRSWCKADLFPVLILLSRIPNMQLWFSYDSGMEFPPRIKGIKTCYLSLSDDDTPKHKVDLVFREDTSTVRKKLGRYNSQVCPYETGLPIVNLTCSSCALCFD